MRRDSQLSVVLPTHQPQMRAQLVERCLKHLTWLCCLSALALGVSSPSYAQPSFSLKKSDPSTQAKAGAQAKAKSKSQTKSKSQSSLKTKTTSKQSPDTPSKTQPQGSKKSDLRSTASNTDAQKSSAKAREKRTLGEERALPDGRVPVKQRASSRDGATGLHLLYSADTGPQGTIRFGLSGSGFTSQEFLTKGIEESSSRLDLSIAYTPIELVEVYANLRSLNYTNPLASPSYIQSQGDLKLGGKVAKFWDTIGAGLALGLQLFSDPEGSGWLTEATSLDIHALFTVDMTRRAQPVPFRFYLDASFTKEKSEALTAEFGTRPSLLQEWGYQSGRYDRLMLNFGMEAPTRYASPFVSYHIGTPFLVEMPEMGQYSRVFAFESVPHFIAGGVRAFALPEVAIELGGTIGISDAPFTGVPATPPWTIWGGITYTLDPRPKVIEREVKVEPPPPKPEPPKPLGALVTLKAVSAADKTPISGARLTFLDAPISPLVSDTKGLFTGHRLAPKRYAVEVSAEGYLSRKLRLPIREGRETFKAQLKLKPDPRSGAAKLEVSYAPSATQSARGDAKPKTLELALYGPETHRAQLSAQSPFTRELKAGDYVLIVNEVGSERQYQEVITLGGKGEAKRVIKPEQLRAPSDSGQSDAETSTSDESAPKAQRGPLKGSTKWVKYNLKKKRISTRAALSFAGEGSKLTKRSKRALKGLASFLKGEPRVKQILVMVHTHSRGDPRADKQLGYRRGKAIKSELTKHGVKASRVAIYSYGSEKNRASNMNRRGRARNQRVLLRIKSLKL